MCKESFVPLSFSVSLSTTSHNYILKEKEREKLFCIWVGEPEQEGGEGRKHRKPDQKPIDLNHISQSEAGLLFHCIASFYPSIFWENSFKKEEKLFKILHSVDSADAFFVHFCLSILEKSSLLDLNLTF